MQEIRVKGLVVRTVNYGEKDRIVSLFTEEMGLITVMANGSRVLKSRSLLATEQFCYGKYLLQQKNERYTVKEVELLESFFDIRKDVEKMALAEYLCQVVYQTGTENQPDRDMLRLILNSLFAIASGRYPLDMVKGAFEMRAAAIFGFMPDLRTCSVCRKESRDVLLDVENGSVICGNCRAEQSGYEPQDSETSTAACLLTDGAREALYYVIFAPLEKLLSFRLTGNEDRFSFSAAAETYLLYHLDCTFKTLDFYKSLSDTVRQAEKWAEEVLKERDEPLPTTKKEE